MFIPTFFGNMSGMNDMTANTSAVITSVERGTGDNSSDCYIKAKYTVDNKEYVKSPNMASSGNCDLTIGQTINIRYNPSNPNSWTNQTESSMSMLQIFFWGGLLVAISSFVTFLIRLFSIIFGWKLLKAGKKLASTLPADTNFQTIKNEVKQNFIKSVFNFGGNGSPASVVDNIINQVKK